MDKLEATNRMKRETKEKGIAVVKFSGNKSIGRENCRRAIKNRADLTKLANVIGRRGTNRRDVLVEGQITVEQDTKVSTVGSWRKNGGTKSNGNGGKFETPLGGATEGNSVF